MTLLALIKAHKLIFALIVAGTLGVIAVGVGCGVGFGVFYKKSSENSATTTSTTTSSPYITTISINILNKNFSAMSTFFLILFF